jgi:hypothetical protein
VGWVQAAVILFDTGFGFYIEVVGLPDNRLLLQY